MALSFAVASTQAVQPAPASSLRGYPAPSAAQQAAPIGGAASSAAAGLAVVGAFAAVAAVNTGGRRSRRAARLGLTKLKAYDGWFHCAQYKDELLATVKSITLPGKGILAMDESNKTCDSRLADIGVEGSEANRRRWRQTLLGTKDLGQYCAGAILFTETLYQDTTDGKKMVDLAKSNGIIPGIKVDTGLVPLVGGKEGEVWCRGLDTLKERTEEYYEAGARFAKWRTTIRVRDHSELAVEEAAHGLAKYAVTCQSSGLVPIIEPEILLDGEHLIDETLEVFEKVWSTVFKACADYGVQLEAVLLKPSMVTPGAQSGQKVDAQTVSSYTLTALKRVVPPSVPGIMFLSGGQSEIQATEHLNAFNQAPNPWHVSFSFARALQNTTLKTWAGSDDNVVAAQAKLFLRAQFNSQAQLGKYDSSTADEDASAAESTYVKNYVY
jgi:fructose-bisphosphate aldolase class I